MSFEDQFIGRFDKNREHAQRAQKESFRSRLEVPEVIKAAHLRAKRDIFSNRDYTVQAPEFLSIYGEESIRKDMQEVLRLKKRFEEDNTPQEKNSLVRAEVLEGIMLMHSELSNWLGDARTMKTSLYDDYKNKTDMFAEWFSPQEGSRVLALGVDVTFSRFNIEKKLHQIKSEIDRGELGKIKYFKDVRGDFMGTRNNIPRVIIGVQPDAIEELAGLWMKNDNKSLAAHPIQRVIVDEISDQLSAMSVYAEKTSKSEPARAYRQAVDTIKNLKSEKSHIPLGLYADDPVANEISAKSKELFR